MKEPRPRAELQKTPSSHIDRQIPLIHLPLALPTKSVSTLTPWLHISFDLNTLIPLFQALPRATEQHGADHKPAKRRKVHSADVPAGHLGYVSYVRVYANCRVRRIWFVSHREHRGLFCRLILRPKTGRRLCRAWIEPVRTSGRYTLPTRLRKLGGSAQPLCRSEWPICGVVARGAVAATPRQSAVVLRPSVPARRRRAISNHLAGSDIQLAPAASWELAVSTTFITARTMRQCIKVSRPHATQNTGRGITP